MRPTTRSNPHNCRYGARDGCRHRGGSTGTGALRRHRQRRLDRGTRQLVRGRDGSGRSRRRIATRSARRSAARPTRIHCVTSVRSCGGTTVAGGPPDRAGIRGLRVGQDRAGLHDHLPRLTELQPRGHAAAPSAGRDRTRGVAARQAPAAAAEHAECGLFATDAESAAALDVDGGDPGCCVLVPMPRTRGSSRPAGSTGARGFYERYLRLGAVLVWCEGATEEARAALWTNRSARIAVPDRAAQACLACLRGS